MGFQEPRSCTFSARLDCHYLLHSPEAVEPQALLVVALHGFAGNPETMLRLTQGMLGEGHVIASLQGPNQFFLGPGRSDVGYGWVTNRHSESSIRLHHDMVHHMLDAAGRESGIPPARRILVGFSQAVALNYRFAATCPDAMRGVIGICGGLPGNWEEGPYQPVKAALLHIARKEDEYYPREKTRHYEERLRLRAADVEFHLLDGGHRFPSRPGSFVERWLQRIL